MTQKRARSILCLPLIKTDSGGRVYIENNLAAVGVHAGADRGY